MPSLHAQFLIDKFSRILSLRDAKDGLSDGYIQAENWNDLAESAGCYGLPKGGRITVKKAEQELTEIFEGDTEEMRDLQDKYLSYANMASDSGYKIGGELLRISLQKDALTLGDHKKDGYTVLAPEDSNQMASDLKIPFKNTKAAREELRLKGVVYNKDSKVARGASSSPILKSMVQKWFDEGATSTTPLVLKTWNKESWGSADDVDLGLGVGDCYLAGLTFDGKDTVTGYIQDVYDYSPIYHGTQIGIITDAVNEACALQDAGKLHKYRVMIPVTVKVDTNSSRTQNLSRKQENWSDRMSKLFTRDQKESTPNWIKAGTRTVVDGTQSAYNWMKNLFK